MIIGNTPFLNRDIIVPCPWAETKAEAFAKNAEIRAREELATTRDLAEKAASNAGCLVAVSTERQELLEIISNLAREVSEIRTRELNLCARTVGSP